jgi:hypothetical protein
LNVVIVVSYYGGMRGGFSLKLSGLACGDCST